MRDFAGKRHQQYAGCWPVEAMNGENVLADLVAYGLHHKNGFVPVEPAAMNQPT